MKNIAENLCYYDPRNPDYTKGTEKKRLCHCDNCFYGRTELAEELLKQQSNMKTIDIQAKEWRDKVNGNSYCAVRVTIDYGMDTEKVLKVPFTYGYGNYYEQAAFELLTDAALIPSKHPGWGSRDYVRENGIIVRSSIQRKCLKRDVIAWGKET